MKEYIHELISVIVPVYNVEKYLPECIESIIMQTYKNLEIILIDDGSLDSSGKICDEYAEKDKRIKVIHKENGGISAARNDGIDISSGEYIAFVDGDDYIDLASYEKMLLIMNNEKADIVSCAVEQFDESGNCEKVFSYFPQGTVKNGSEIAKLFIMDKLGSYVWKAFYKKKCWEEVRFPENRTYEDIFVTFRAYEKAEKIVFCSDAFYKYRKNTQSITSSVTPQKIYDIFCGFKERYYYSEKKYPEISAKACSIAMHYAVGIYCNYCADKKNGYSKYKDEAKNFLSENKNKYDKSELKFSRNLMIKVFGFSKTLFKILSRVYSIIAK